MATLPEGAGFPASIRFAEKPTKTFLIDWASKRITGMDSGLAAMSQAVDIMLQNERFAWQIYSSRFGSELEGLVGEEYDYIVSEVPRRIQEALSVDNRVLSVEDFVFSEPDGDQVTCGFRVVTVFGTLSKEVVL